MSGVEGLKAAVALLESRCAAIDLHYQRFPNSLDRTMEDTAKAIRTALSAIEGGGGALQPSASVPTEWSERPEVVLQYAQQLATVAAHKVGCVPEWRPLDDVYGCLSQIDNCLTGLVATPPATPIAGDVLWLDRWADLERLAKAASAVVGQPDEEDWFMPQHFANLEPEDAAFIAATNPAAILELIAAARRDEEAGQ